MDNIRIQNLTTATVTSFLKASGYNHFSLFKNIMHIQKKSQLETIKLRQSTKGLKHLPPISTAKKISYRLVS